ncbi:MAG: hypothetical protein V2A67_09545 [Bacteroidota bacterium]
MMFCKILIYIALAPFYIYFAREPAMAGGDNVSVIRLTQKTKRTWISPEIWANPLQDWQLNKGRMECIGSGGERNLFLLTNALSDQQGSFFVRVKAGRLNSDRQPLDEGWIGFSLGVRGNLTDYRDDAVRGEGYPVGITTDGKMFIGRHIDDQAVTDPGKSSFVLIVEGKSQGGMYLVTLTVLGSAGKELGRMDSGVEPDWLTGGVALVCHEGKTGIIQDRRGEVNNKIQGFKPGTERNGNVCFWFSDWSVGGEKFIHHEERAWGPVLFCQYTLSGKKLKLTAQLAPVGIQDGQTARLEVDRNGIWETIAESPVDSIACVVDFRIENWNELKDVPYRVRYSCYTSGKRKSASFYTGTIRHEPWEKEEIVIAAFNGNSESGFPHADIVKSVTWQDPDLLFFSGGQISTGSVNYEIQTEPVDKSVLDYLRKWYLFGWAFGDLLRSRPTVSITGDQDIYQDQGGYQMDPAWINMVQKTQTSHLPDPASPAAVGQGVWVYYTEVRYAGISFAVIEDHKFKSDPASLLPEARIIKGRALNPEFSAAVSGDVPGALLLGEMQEQFLEQWTNDWTNGIWIKVVLSQNIFSNMATRPVGGSHDIVDQDFNSNSWPQTARNRALTIMRKGYAVQIAGNQGIGGVIQYGTMNWRDAGYAFCVPPVSNISPRRWCPEEPGYARFELDPRYTGDYVDGFGNKMTVFAAANPSSTGLETALLNERAEGYGIVRLNRNTRDITMECWPPKADPSNPGSKQYLGWPVKINQLSNRAQYAQWELPLIKVPDMKNSVMQVISESTGMIQYTIRINGHAFRPPVDKPGKYTLFVGDPGSDRWIGIPGFEATPSYITREYVVRF